MEEVLSQGVQNHDAIVTCRAVPTAANGATADQGNPFCRLISQRRKRLLSGSHPADVSCFCARCSQEVAACKRGMQTIEDFPASHALPY